MSPSTYRIPQDNPIVEVTGGVTSTGLSTGYRYTEVSLPTGVWTPLPASPLTGRNTMSVQNESNQDIRLNSDKTDTLPVGLSGVLLRAFGERFYNVTDGVIIYARQDSGASVVVGVEEIA